MAVCAQNPNNLIQNWDFSASPDNFAGWVETIGQQGNGWGIHLSQCGTDFWPNHGAEADHDQAGGNSWDVGDEAYLHQDVGPVGGVYDRLVLQYAESHHTDLANPGVQEVKIYGSDNQVDWTQIWHKPRVEEAARGAGKNCEALPQFTYVIPLPQLYDYYRVEFHALLGSEADGSLFSWVELWTATAETAPAVGATSTVTEVNGRNNQTVANDSITITEAGGVLLAVLACYDAEGVAVGSSVVLDPGGPEEANFSFVAGQHDVSGAATLRVELWQLVNPPAGAFTVRGTVTATCHNVVVGAQQYGEIGGIGALVSNTRTLVNDANAPPALRLQPQTGSRVVMASIQRLLATYTTPIPGDNLRFQKQSQDGTSVRAVTVALVDTAVEADTCWTGLEVAADPASIQEWAAIGVELLAVDEEPTPIEASAVDEMALGETTQRNKIVSASVADGFALGGSIGNTAGYMAPVADMLLMGEATDLTGILSSLGADVLTMGELHAIAAVLSAAASDGLALSGAVNAQATLTGAATDTLTFSEALGVAALLSALAADGIAVGDVATGAMSGEILASAVDGLRFGEATTTAAQILAHAADALQIGDVITSILQLMAQAQDGLSFEDVAAMGGQSVLSAADGIVLGDVAGIAAVVSAIVQDGVVFDDEGQVQAQFVVVAEDAVSFVEALQAVMALAAIATDGFRLGDVSAVIEAKGAVTVSFTVKRGGITFTVKKPGVVFRADQPGVDFSS